MGGLILAAIGVVLVFMAYKGPAAWRAAWAEIVRPA